MNIMDIVDRMLEPVRNRIRMMVVQGLIKATKSEDGITLTLDLLSDETRDDVDLVQQYGISSRPKPGTRSVSLCIGGSRDSMISIATQGLGDDMKIELQEGEVALHTSEGDKVHLKNGRVIEVVTETFMITATKEIIIDSPQTTSYGEISDSTGNLSTLRDAYNAHTHIGNLGAPTSPPDQIDSGG